MPVGNIIKCRAVSSSVAGETPAYDIYVDPVRGFDLNDGLTPLNALRTVEKAEELVGVAGGKTIGLMSGSYPVVTIGTEFTAETVYKSIVDKGAIFSRLESSGPIANCQLRDFKVFYDAPAPVPDPSDAKRLIYIRDGITDVVFDNLDVSCVYKLRSFFAIALYNSTRVTIRNSEFHESGAGIRFPTSTNDCVVEDNVVHGLCGSICGTGGINNSGLTIRRNHFYDCGLRPGDPEWTDNGQDSGSWASLHSSWISLRDIQGALIQDNILHSARVSWIQLYGGEDQQVYNYSDITIEGNLVYDVEAAGYLFNFGPANTDYTEQTGPIIIRDNTFFGAEAADWNAQSYTDINDRFDEPVFNANGIVDTFANIIQDNIFCCAAFLPAWAENNVTWANNADTPTWAEEQFVTGTGYFEKFLPVDETRTGYTFVPRGDGVFTTAAKDGGYVGAVEPQQGAPILQTAAIIGPQISPGFTVTIEDAVAIGYPSPINLVSSVLRLNGQDVTASIYNGDQYDIPAGAALGVTLELEQTFSNGVGADLVSTTTETVITPPLAFGGTVTEYDDGGTTYRLHRLDPGDTELIVNSSGDVDVFIVPGAGGGGDGNFDSAGGGSAGLPISSTVSVTPQTYTAVIGTGGAGALDGDSYGENGTLSSIFGLTAQPGVGGGSRRQDGRDGINGSGAGGGLSPVGGNTTGGGFDGGNGGTTCGGGGAGAGANGQNSTSSTGGNGGDGIQSDIAGTLIYYCGGGGAGVEDSATETPGTGGLGGGGNGGNPGGDGSNGGAGGGGNKFKDGGAGSDGFIYVRYAV